MAVLLALLPRLAFGLVPAVAHRAGGYGLVVAHDYGFWGYAIGNYTFLPLGDYNIQYYLVLPLAYGLAALGGWLGWRALDRQRAGRPAGCSAR